MGELSWNALKQIVYERAHGCCEYCQTCEATVGKRCRLITLTPKGTTCWQTCVCPAGVEAARSILHFRLAQANYDRVNELAAKARAGTLTAEEREELDEYERITCLVELMQSKARLSLKGGKHHGERVR